MKNLKREVSYVISEQVEQYEANNEYLMGLKAESKEEEKFIQALINKYNLEIIEIFESILPEEEEDERLYYVLELRDFFKFDCKINIKLRQCQCIYNMYENDKF